MNCVRPKGALGHFLASKSVPTLRYFAQLEEPKAGRNESFFWGGVGLDIPRILLMVQKSG